MIKWNILNDDIFFWFKFLVSVMILVLLLMLNDLKCCLVELFSIDNKIGVIMFIGNLDWEEILLFRVFYLIIKVNCFNKNY